MLRKPVKEKMRWQEYEIDNANINGEEPEPRIEYKENQIKAMKCTYK